MIKKNNKPFRPVAEKWMKYPPKRTMLDEINALVDWRKIYWLLERMYKKDMGRPAIPPLGMFKLLLLESFYDLSDAKKRTDTFSKALFIWFGRTFPLANNISHSCLLGHPLHESLITARYPVRVLRCDKSKVSVSGISIKAFNQLLKNWSVPFFLN